MIKKTLLAASLTSLLLLPVIASAAGFGTVTPFAGTSTGTLIQAIMNIVNALLTLAAVIAVIFVIIGGVRYITSQGDDDAQVEARNTIIYAIIGVVVIALSAVIINYIIRAIP